MTKLISIFCALLTVSACAWVIDGKKQEMSFDSNEKDVEIFVNGKMMCTTPCTAEIRRSNEKLRIVAKKDGFDERSLTVEHVTNKTTYFNISSLGWSWTGFTTDYSSQSIWEYQPDSFYITLVKLPKTEAEKKIFAEQNNVRHFVLTNFASLQNEVYQNPNNGEYLKSLSTLTNIPTMELAAILQNCDDAPNASEKVVAKYLFYKN